MFRKLIPFAALLLLAGCKTDPNIVAGTPRPKEYKTVISLSPSTSELLGATNKAGLLLKGRTRACNFPADVPQAPVVCDVKPDFEKIAKIHPDLILYDKDLFSDSDIAKLKTLGADMFILDATTLDKFEAEAASLASMVGGETPMSEYIDRVNKAVQTARASGDENKNTTVAMISPGKGGEHYIAGTDSFQAEEIRLAGAKPIGPKSSKFEVLSPETLLKDDPDFIVTGGDPTDFVKDSRFAGLKAVKTKGHVFGIKDDIAYRRGFRVDVFILNVYKQIEAVKHG